jgi:signal transduction histidine kinase
MLGLLLVGGALVAGLILAAADGQDRLAVEKSIGLVGAVVSAQQRNLARTATDYSWWDDAYEHLARTPDAGWAVTNVGPSAYDTFGITVAAVLDARNRTVLAFRNGAPAAVDLLAESAHGLEQLIAQARAQPTDRPQSASGYILYRGRLQLASIGALLPNTTPLQPVATAARDASVLVFLRELDEKALAELGQDYGIEKLRLVPPGGATPRTGLTIAGADGAPLGWLAWRTDRPGRAIFKELLLPLAVAFAAIGLLAFIVLWQIERGRREAARLAARNTATLHAIAEGILVLDRQLRVIDWNPALLAMQALPEGLLRPGLPFVELLRVAAGRGDFAPESPDQAVAGHLARTAAGDAEPTEWRLPGGRIAELRRSALPGGGVVLSYRDITLHKQAEETLRAARDQADLANQAKSEFLANVSHELRTPLNAILGFSEMMRDEMIGPLGQPRYREFASDIYDSGTHLLAIINDILDLSKIEAGKLELHDEVVSVVELFDTVHRFVRERAGNAGLTIALDVPAGLPPVRADKRALKQVLLNLLSNAIKFTPAGGRITLQAVRGGDGGVEFRVRDTGIGIAAGDIPKALEPFGQVDGSLARKYPGAGLGLPISRALVELHRGRFALSSEPGVGTTVTVGLPPDRIAA